MDVFTHPVFINPQQVNSLASISQKKSLVHPSFSKVHINLLGCEKSFQTLSLVVTITQTRKFLPRSEPRNRGVFGGRMGLSEWKEREMRGGPLAKQREPTHV